jgi:outer membrane receptor for ferrienterochelin and colicin
MTDAETGESLVASTVFEINSKKGAAGNAFGFYSLTLPPGSITVQYSYAGYEAQTLNLKLSHDTTINIRMKQNNVLQEVTVTANRANTGVQSVQIGAVEVPIAQIKAIPSILGENDLIKALQLLPGVQSGTEGFTGFYVRGGGPDENLFLLDGVPVYNINHLGGFFSVFNNDAIKSVTLYKGGFPARFGSRLSSVLDVRMNDGNNKKIHGNVSIGLISSRLNVEGPLGSEKTTFSISARRTYFDILMKPFVSSSNNTAGYYFYDLSGKLSHRISDKDRLYASFYMGDDVIYASSSDWGSIEKLGWNWGNMLAVGRWNHIINNKLFMNATATYTRYRFDMNLNNSSGSKADINSMSYKSGIHDYSAKLDFDYSLNPDNEIKFGADYIDHTFRPGIFTSNEEGSETVIGDKNISASELALYAEDNINLGRNIKANLGLRYSTFFVQDKYYGSLQPRLSLRALLADELSVKAAYGYMSQYIHLLSNNTVSLPTDLWVPVTKRITPMQSHQLSTGIFYNLNNLVDLSAEIYYKTMNNLIEYKEGASFLGSATGWEDKVAMGRGWAYGIELMAQKTIGKTTGWIGYTWSKSDRLFDRRGEELNFGRTFPAKYDRRHDINIVATHRFSKKIDLTATWVFSTGNSGTLPMHKMEIPDIPGSEHTQSSIDYIESRNNYRYPNYHRLDLGANFHKQTRLGLRTWSISIYNTYNHMNPFLIYPQEDWEYIPGPDGSSVRKSSIHLRQSTLFPIIPSISYTLSF